MGWKEFFGFSVAETMQAEHPSAAIKSPWSSPGNLPQVVMSDILGVIPTQHVSRDFAMSVPAFARGHHLLVTSIASLPLRALDSDDNILADQPRWITRTDGAQSPQYRMVQTISDLIFDGMSLWALQRESNGRVSHAVHVPSVRWLIADDGSILIDEQPVSQDSVLLIPGFHAGILSFGADTLRSAKQLEQVAAKNAEMVVPVVELHDTYDVNLTPAEAQALTTTYANARKDPQGAVMYTPNRIDLKVHGTPPTDVAVQARNQSAIDIARMLGIPGAMLDASNVNASHQYETVTGRNAEFVQYSLATYTNPVEAALSADNIIARGNRVRFDLAGVVTDALAPTGPHMED